jgi:hypothetical protein
MDKEAQTYLKQYFLDIASWHECWAAAVDCQENRGRLARARLFRRLAIYIERLPIDDLRLTSLARLAGSADGYDFSPGQRLSAAIADVSRFTERTIGSFLDYLVHAALEDQLADNRHVTAVMLECAEPYNRIGPTQSAAAEQRAD